MTGRDDVFEHPIGLHEPELDAQDESLVLEALRSSWISTGGPFVDKFEKKIAEYVGAKCAVSTCSGTVALQLLVQVLAQRRGFDHGFDVLVPDLTFIATANAVVHAGGAPVFVDTATGSLGIDPAAVESIIRTRYRYDAAKGVWFSHRSNRPLLGVLPAHLMGWAADMGRLKALCAEFGLLLFEDAAEALGVFWPNGQHVGRDGVAAVFSFNANKILTTGGGGMIVTDDEPLARHLKHLSTTAKVEALRFVHDKVGYNFRLVNVLAALGCSQLDKLETRLARKAEIDLSYRREFDGVEGVLVHRERGVRSNHWLVNLRFATNEMRERALTCLLGERVLARPLWTPLHLQPAFSTTTAEPSSFTQAIDIWEHSLSLPSSPQLTDETVNQIARIVKDAVAGLRRAQ